MNQEKVKLSKHLSFVLRHKPEKIGLTLSKEGWANIEDLIEKSLKNSQYFTREIIKEIVQENNKKRFELNENETLIRACQGHSIEVDLKLKVKVPPAILYHGTAETTMPKIRKSCGLSKINRQHVHLSEDVETAKNVGSRHGKVVVIKIAASLMLKDGYKFYQSKNGVWLTDEVPSKYFIIG